MDAYKLSNGKIRVPFPQVDEKLGLMGDEIKDLDSNDPEAQKWIKWYAERGESVPKLPVVAHSDDARQSNTNFGKFGRFGKFNTPE